MFSQLRRALPLALLALAACGGTSSDSTAIPPARVEYAVPQLDSIIADIMARSGVPGMAVAVVHRGETVYARGFGVRRQGGADTVDPATVFQLASVSKSVGATVVAAQVGKGVVAWDTHVVQHLPWFSIGDAATSAAVTVGDLYAHRSGLPDHAGDDIEELGYSQRDVLERLRLLPAEPLGEKYFYTNFGLTAAALAVAEASGADWSSLSDEVLYRPLGMTATSSRHADFMARANRAYPHILQDGRFVPGIQRQPDAQSPAGGVSSNVLDMATWMKMVLAEGRHQGREIVAREALRPALAPQMMSTPPSDEGSAGYYGYGFNVATPDTGNIRFSHSGAFTLGASTTFTLLPAADTGIVVLVNSLPVGAAEAVSLSYIDLVESGQITRDWLETVRPLFAEMMAPAGRFAGQPFPASPAPTLPAHAYTGVYFNDYYGEAAIQERAEGLVLLIGPDKRELPLRHWDGDTFVFEASGESAPAGSRSAVSFEVGPGGIASEVTIELYDENGLGTLTRR